MNGRPILGGHPRDLDDPTSRSALSPALRLAKLEESELEGSPIGDRPTAERPSISERLGRDLDSIAHGYKPPVSHLPKSDEGEPEPLDDDAEVACDEANATLKTAADDVYRNRIDEIALLVQSITYGEMIEVAEAMWKAQPTDTAITQENLPKLLHQWAKSRRSSRNRP